MNIGSKIFIGYAVALAALAVISILAFSSASQLADDFDAGTDQRNLIRNLDAYHDLILSMQENQRVFLLNGDASRLDPLRRSRSSLDTVEAETLADSASAEFADEIKAIRRSAENLVAALEREVEIKTADPAALSTAVGESHRLMEEMVSQIESVKATALAKYNDLHGRTESTADRLELFILVGAPSAFLLSALIGFFITRDITVPLGRLGENAGRIAAGDLSTTLQDSSRRDEIGSLSRSFEGMVAALRQLIGEVQRSGLQVNSAAVEISATTKEQQTTAGEVATTTAEISATAKEMSATSTELLKTADGVSSVAEQASTLAAEGKRGLERMESIMRGILEASSSITAKLGVMNEKAGNINAVVTAITKVADQTNLLSLNAAIEAEKAGEYGRGFAVVATEIRRLADQTAASTGDIEQMVGEMVSAVSTGVMGMDKFAEELRRGAGEIAGVGAQLDRVILEVQSLAPSVESVNEGMRSQTQGARQISEALAQLGDAARLTADSIRDSSRSVEQLGEAARWLQTGISKFKLPA